MFQFFYFMIDLLIRNLTPSAIFFCTTVENLAQLVGIFQH